MHDAQDQVRSHYRLYHDWLNKHPEEELAQKRKEADLLFRRVGITFAVYGDESGAERLIPFDAIPRMIPASEWTVLEHGLRAMMVGVELVEGQDLFVSDGWVWMRTTAGPQKVDVIYRRIDDDFLDPQMFRANLAAA